MRFSSSLPVVNSLEGPIDLIPEDSEKRGDLSDAFTNPTSFMWEELQNTIVARLTAIKESKTIELARRQDVPC